MKERRQQQAEFAAWIGIVGNLILAVVKGFVGFVGNSRALIADAAHSASDVAGSAAVLVGLKASKKPPDPDHPYGHGKAEPIAAIIVSVLLIVVGVEIGIRAVEAIFSGELSAPAWYTIVVVAVSIVAKEIMFQYKYRLGRKLNSQALIANAWEHRSDVFSSMAALIGIAGAFIGGVWGMEWLLLLDPVAGLLVCLLVLRMGYKLIRDSIHSTLDHVLHEDDAEELIQTAEKIPGVIAVNELRAREHGHYVVVDIKIAVNPKIPVWEGHEIGKKVKYELMDRFHNVSDVFVHVNPYDQEYPYKNNVNSDSDDLRTLLH